MMESFGARLRRERERRKIAIADIAARTKIKASLFEALERNDVSQWPAGLFRRSFLRAYAEAVGLNPQETLRDFLANFPDPADSSAASGAAPEARAVAAAPAALPLAPPLPLPLERTSILRLTLADTAGPLQVPRVRLGSRRRWAAAACDLGVVLSVALLAFLLVHQFWMPFGLAAAGYYLAGVVLLGTSPGMSLVAPREPTAEAPAAEPLRTARPRHTEPARIRHLDSPRNPFRSARRARTTRT